VIARAGERGSRAGSAKGSVCTCTKLAPVMPLLLLRHVAVLLVLHGLSMDFPPSKLETHVQQY